MTHRFDWITALASANLRSALARPGRFLSLAVFMGLNNLIWFALWALFFNVAGRVRGWTVQDVGAMFGIVAVAYGLYAVFFGGARHLAERVLDGGLDIYLGRPRSALLGLLFSHSEPTGAGDIVSGLALIFWATSPDKGVLALGFAMLGASVIVATYVAINTLVFWTGGRASVFDQLFGCFLTLAATPQMGLPMAAKILVYTALPAAFVGFVPVEILRDFSGPALAAMVAAAVLAPLAAAWLFGRGLKRYASGNRMVETR
jgi:ABC-2 type transport system permease protein